jgi:hypothetical protein
MFLNLMVEKSTRIKYAFNFLLNQILISHYRSQIFELCQISKGSDTLSLYYNFATHSGDKRATYSCSSLCLLIDQRS